MKKKIFAMLLCLTIIFTGCGQKAEEISNEELNSLRDKITDIVSNNKNYNNFSNCYVDSTSNVVVVELVDNSIEKQNEFKNLILDSKNIEFKQGKQDTIVDLGEYGTGLHHAQIKIKNYGIIELELDSDTAPITVSNFAKLVNNGFYDGLTFHRIIDGFMIQGGDPNGNGTGGSSETIKGEFSINGVSNNISHVRGVISMARSSSFDSASSQFFIVHEDSTYLDGQYAAFGRVTKGMEIVDKICEDTEVVDDNGTVLRKNQPIIEKITMID
ncbi:MAG: peptidylprolyl isomerase [Clostridium sp.]|nr:peptidylprolyl isomerase [Clostridium sp.]MCM1444275.1 peptidylprolyl isomerase [Candidatus Amulumruptor caecigallinarius]